MSKRKPPFASVARWDRVFNRVCDVLQQETQRAIEEGDRYGGAGAIIGGVFMAMSAWLRHEFPNHIAPTSVQAADAAMAIVVGELAICSDARAGRSEMDTTLAQIRAEVKEEFRRQHFAQAAASTQTPRPQ